MSNCNCKKKKFLKIHNGATSRQRPAIEIQKFKIFNFRAAQLSSATLDVAEIQFWAAHIIYLHHNCHIWLILFVIWLQCLHKWSSIFSKFENFGHFEAAISQSIMQSIPKCTTACSHLLVNFGRQNGMFKMKTTKFLNLSVFVIGKSEFLQKML